ncbi:MAG: response regulator transcription factor [Lachnospiraceae bacterium]|nr:response regulator transcription factor [Lachnospiraceae bacterium]
MKILLAEDTRDLNRAVTALLDHEGYEVDSAFDGEEAMDYILKSDYDGVVLDIMMPKKDGLEVLTEMRSRHILTPVMLLTAKTEIDDRVAGLDAGADDYLPKPFAMKELLARIRSMTRRSKEYGASELTFEDITLNPKDFVLSARNTVILTAKEYELMDVLLANKDTELSTEYLLSHIWRNEENAHADTVWLYITYLKGKLKSVGSKVGITGAKGESFRLSI